MRDYEYSDLYFDSHLDKQMHIDVVGTGITIDNSMIELDAFELDETLCSESELKFGCCEANCVKFTARDMPGSIVGKTIRITEAVDGNTDSPFLYGVYKVYSDVPTSDRTKREITAYDAMYDIITSDVKPWYAGLLFPMTLRQFRDSFFAHFGITQKEVTLVNDGMTVNKTLVATQTDSESTITEESTISGKTVIEAICEINGVFGNINRDGLFEYVELKQIIDPLYPADNLYPSDDLFPRDPNTISMTGHYITFDYEDFQTRQIAQLEIRPSDDSAGATVGTSGNNYVISGNFIVSDKEGSELEVIAANTLSIIRKASYTPIKSSEIVGNPCIELGDPIRFNTTREIVESYVLQRTLTGIQSKRDSIVSPGTEVYNQNPNGIKAQIENVQRRTNKLERTADHTLSELADLDANTSSRFEQTAEQIQTEVSNRQNADNEMSTRISQTAHSVAITANGGDNSVGITINLYDENGNLIDSDSGNANITIVGVVRFEDLSEEGSTVINGSNIKTGIIKSSDSEFTRAKFYEGIYYALNYNGSEYKYPVFVINEPGNVEYGVDNMNTNFHGSCVFNDSRIYIGSYRVATINDLSGYAKSSDIPSSSYLDNRYMHQKTSGGSDGTGSVFVHGVYYSSGDLTVTTASVSSSDERLKTNISDMPDMETLYLKFKPKKFRFDDRLKGYDHRWHYGLLAQSVENDLIDAGIFLDDTGLIWKEPVYEDFHEREVIGDDQVYKLDKDELHAMHIQMIQKLWSRCNDQQSEINDLRFINMELSGELSILKRELEEIKDVINNKINQS